MGNSSLMQVKAKFVDNCALTIPADRAEQLWNAMLNLDEMNDSGFFVKPTVILDFREFLSTL